MCFPCEAYIGIHQGSPNHKPLGTLAKAPLRKLRTQAHTVFDPLWKGKKSKMSRSSAYKMLAKKLNINSSIAHIGMMDEARCREVIKIFSSPF